MVSIIIDYIEWHYTSALKRIFHVWSNFFWFLVAFFSITQLLKSLFSPWKRITEDRGRTFSFEDLAGYVIIGLISRIIGFIMRFFVILIGLVSLIVLCVGLVATYVFWLSAPFLIPTTFLFGLVFLFK